MYVPAGDRVVALDAATGTEKWRHVVTGGTPSRRGVGYWPGAGRHGRPDHLHRRPPVDRDRRGHRGAFRRLRHERRSRPGHSVQLGAARPRQRRRRRREHAAGDAWRDRQRARVRRTHRCEAVGVQLGAAAGPRRPRHVGGRQLEGSPRRERVAVLLHRRRRARHALHSAGVADSWRLGRRPRRREPVRQLRRRRRSADREVQVAFPDDSPRSLGCRSAGASGAVRRGPQRQAGAGAGADDEVGLPVSVESRELASRCSASRSGRSRRATFPARRHFRRSRSRSSLRRSGASRIATRISSPRRIRRPSTRRRAASWCRRWAA